MPKIEFALISALYDVRGADLYREIYFPIIKYSLVEMYFDQLGEQKVFDLDSLQVKIEKLFGITIPSLVLRQCVKALEVNRDGIDLKYYEDNQLIKIIDVWDITVNESIDERANSLRQRYEQLEIMFQTYLKTELLECNKTFFDFFSDYADDSTLFINQGGSDVKVDENYANLTSFISWVKKNDDEMYTLIDEVFWGAIIAGFLRRDNVDLGLKAVEKVDYYLDSSLVLAILGLDSKENVEYARQMLDIIKDSGSIPRVHALTIREIDRILGQVELQQGPRPGSAIESAFEWGDMSLSKILSIRNSLPELLDKEYNVVVGMTSSRSLDEIENKYKNKAKVKELALERGHSSTDNFREIHDVFMCEMVQKANYDKSTTEKFEKFFVTLNGGLITSMQIEGVPSSIIHSGNVVLNLWLHSSRSKLLRKSGLIEVVARSFAMNKTDVRRRLKRFRKILGGPEYSAKDVQSMYNALLRRSKETIQSVDALLEKTDDISDDERSRMMSSVIKAASMAEEERQKLRLDDAKKIQQLKSDVDEAKKLIEDFQKGKSKDEETINKLKEIVTTAALGQKESEQEIEKLKSALKQQEQRANKLDMLSQKRIQKQQLEIKRQDSVSLLKFWLIISLEGAILLLLILFIGCLIYYWDNSPEAKFVENIKNNIGKVIGGVTSLLMLVLRLKDMYLLTPVVCMNRARQEQLLSWDFGHPEYINLVNEINELEKQIKEESSI